MYVSGIVVLVYFVLHQVVMPRIVSPDILYAANGMMRLVCAGAVMAAMGMMHQKNGLFTVFYTKGLGKSLFLLLPIFVYAAVITAYFVFGGYPLREHVTSQFLTVMFLGDLGTGIFEEVLFRGLLIGVIMRSKTESNGRRVGVMILSAAITSALSFGGFVEVFIASMLFAAAYIYSKNIAGGILASIVFYVAIKLPGLYVYDLTDHTMSGIIHAANLTFMIIVPIAAVLAAIKASPFADDEEQS